MKKYSKRIGALLMALLTVMTTIFGDVSSLKAIAAAAPRTIAEFVYSTDKPVSSLPAQATTGEGTIELNGATFANVSSMGLNVNAITDLAWTVTVDAAAYENLTFEAAIRSSKTGTRHFGVRCKAEAAEAWKVLDEKIELTDTNQQKLTFSLPTEIKNTKVLVQIYARDDVSVNNGTVAVGGTTSLNNVKLSGTVIDGMTAPEMKAKCETVISNVDASQEVEKDTEVILSTATEGAKIYYSDDNTTNFKPYEGKIVINASKKIKAYASKDGYLDSDVVTFEYKLKAAQGPTTPETPEVVAKVATLDNTLVDGDKLLVYCPNAKKVLGLTDANNKKVVDGTDAAVLEGKITLAEGMAELKAVAHGDAFYLVADGKFLTSGATGSTLTFETSANEYALWKLGAATTADCVYLINANAKYNGNPQYLEYYKGFKPYSYQEKNEDSYALKIFKTKHGAPSLPVDSDVTNVIAQWGGNANYDEANVKNQLGIYGDLYSVNDLKDTNAEFTAVVNGNKTVPYDKATSSNTGSTNYYMLGAGLGTGNNDYMQFTFPTKGYGNMKMSFRLRATNTAPGSLQLQYSTDGTNFDNFEEGTYKYAYTVYKNETPSEESGSGKITDGVARTSLAPTYYVSFSFDVPRGADNAEKLYVRMIPGKKVATSEKNKDGSEKVITKGATIRVDSVKVMANPIVSDSIVGYVKSSIAADEETNLRTVAKNTKLELSTATDGATIKYTVDGGEVQTYDASKGIVLSKLPCVITTYATKSGLADSIKMMYQFEQSKCETVKATPNGGAVVKGAKVTLKTKTEDAKIYYASYKEGQEEATLEWKEYSGVLSLDKLPVSYKVKAVKEGYEDSVVSTLAFSEKANSKYEVLFGQVHAHTNFSDGAGTCEEAFQYARKVDNLDYLVVTDHSNSLDNAADSVISKNVDTKDTDEWTYGHALAKKYSDDKFTCLYGYEMTWSNGLGHMNTFNTAGFQSRTQKEYSTYATALQNYYKALNTAPDSISMFNHPGTTFGDFSDFAYYTEANDYLINMIEVGNGEGTIGSSGYFPSYEYYTRALDKGWHIAPTNNQDNHKAKWGDANTARTVALTNDNSQDAIYDAMRNRRMYATEDNNLYIYYTLNDNIMGTILEKDAVGDTVSIKAEIKDPDAKDIIGNVQVIVNGGLCVASKKITSNQATVEFEVPANYSYYYLKVTEGDKDIAVTAPVWVGEVEACGINKTSTTTDLPVAGENANIKLELYNNEKKDLEITSITYATYEEVIKKMTAEELAAAGKNKVAPNDTLVYELAHTEEKAGTYRINVEVHATLNGVDKIYKDVLTITYSDPRLVTNVLVDGTHYNDYVTGYYGGNMGNFTKIAAEQNVRVTIVKDEITPEMLKNCSALVVSAPAKKSGTANAGEYKVSHFEDSFISMVAEYVANGGTLIACGIADYQDSTDCQTATEMNKLLKACGSTIKMNSDEAYDEVNNGGQQYRLYYSKLDKQSPYLKGAVFKEDNESNYSTYSAYSGCTVSITSKEGNDKVYPATALVSGHDTTYSINCKNDDGSKGDSGVDVKKGEVIALAHQKTKANGNIFVGGTVFLSDFEVKAEKDNNDDLPYANYNIACNLLDEIKVELPVSSIKDARAGEHGDIFSVEGYVTSGTTNPNTTFFDTIFIQDETAGIDIFPYAEAGLAIGTKVRVTGTVDEFQGDRELRVISVEVLKNAETKVYAPKVVSTKDAMDYAKLGGSLLTTTGVVSRVEMASDNKTVAEFWLKDETGVEAAIFIDGYITSATTGVNNLADFVKVGAKVTATGILYMHPEGDSNVFVPVFRVRSCDDITLVEAGTGTQVPTPGVTVLPSGNVSVNLDVTTATSQDEVNANMMGAIQAAVDTAASSGNANAKVEVNFAVNNRTSEIDKAVIKAAMEAKAQIRIENKESNIVWSFDAVNKEVSFSTKATIGTQIAGVDKVLKSVTLPTTIKTVDVAFEHHGDLPGTAEVTMNLLSQGFKNNSKVYMYYFNPSKNKFELIDTAIYADGVATFTMTHCSDYVITSEPLPAAIVATTKTGDNSNIAFYVLLLLAGLVALAYVAKAKRVKR